MRGTRRDEMKGEQMRQNECRNRGKKRRLKAK